MNAEDVERLGSRLAMVVSEDGEAENAGRALGQLARRLGLTGGQLKAMFVAGANGDVVDRPSRPKTSEAERLEREIATLRHSLRLFEERAAIAERERDALLDELSGLRSKLFRTQANSRARTVLALAILAAAGLAGAVSYLMVPGGPIAMNVASVAADLAEPMQAPPPVAASSSPHVALVRAARAPVFRQPDPSAPVLAVVPAGKALVVRRLLWNMMVQWAEIDIAGGGGYIAITDINMT